VQWNSWLMAWVDWNEFLMSQSSLITPMILLFSNSAKFRGSVEIPPQRANFAARLEILRPAENCGPYWWLLLPWCAVAYWCWRRRGKMSVHRHWRHVSTRAPSCGRWKVSGGELFLLCLRLISPLNISVFDVPVLEKLWPSGYQHVC